MNNNIQQNPYYYGMQGYPQANPYMRAYQQPQMPQMQYQQVQSIPGKFIQSLQEIVVSDVPQDGSVAFFPTADYKKIYAKGWNADGTIHTEEYILVSQEKVEKPTFESDILARLGRIEEMLSQPAKKSVKKKEVDSDD